MQQRILHICRRQPRRIHRCLAHRLRVRPVVQRRFVGEFSVRDLGHSLAVLPDAEFAIAGHGADLDRFEPPLAEDFENFGLAPLGGHQQHSFLRFRKHDVVRRHAGFALRDAVELDLDADLAAAAHFAGRAGQPGGAHVLDPDNGAGLHGFEAGFEQ
jgi:hypothetical protein